MEVRASDVVVGHSNRVIEVVKIGGVAGGHFVDDRDESSGGNRVIAFLGV